MMYYLIGMTRLDRSIDKDGVMMRWEMQNRSIAYQTSIWLSIEHIIEGGRDRTSSSLLMES